MLSALAARARIIGEAARGRAIGRGVARLREEFPGVAVTGEAEAIVLSGRGLRARLADDARLRWIGSLWR